MAKGLSVGTFTSPNLHEVAERLARNAEPIDDAALAEVLTELALLEAVLSERPSRFELLTAAALSWFATEAVDSMVVEVGVGGTWDSTNVVHGDVAVITNVSFDHTDVLGPTLEGIAADKAGIVERGSRVVVGEMAPELVEVVAQRAVAAGAASVWVAGRDFGCSANRVAVGGRLLTLWTPGGTTRTSCCRCTAPTRVTTRPWPSPPRRRSSVSRSPPLWSRRVWPRCASPDASRYSGAGRCSWSTARDNAAGMAALGDALTEEFAVDGVSVAVVGMLSGRDPSAMLAPLASAGVTAVVACEPESPRAMPVTAVSEAGRALGLAVSRSPTCAAHCAWPAGWSTPTASSSWPARSTWWARRAPTRSPRRSPGRMRVADDGADGRSDGLVESTPRGPHPCHREAGRSRAGPGR